MRNKVGIALIMCILAMGVLSCKKDTDPNLATFKIVKEMEKVVVGTTEATISGTYEYPGKINSIKVRMGIDPQLFGSDLYATEVSGKAYSVHVTGLRSGSRYYYRYEVDYGAKEDFLSEISDFTTQSESPTVKTLEVMALDSTTFRIKCEVLSGGGQEVTERGICWNTYGDPTLDDETMQHDLGGFGQYTIRMENLALGKKYYVRAYAKSSAGIGLSEDVLAFETETPHGVPVEIELSSNPESGGTVSGGGTFEVGTQCTVTAEANTGYTFINWTENGVQVSSEASYTFPVTVARSLVANFTMQAFVITVQVDPDDSGTVTGAGGYNYGEPCTLTATAKTGYDFVKWTKNGTTVSNDAEYSFTVNATATYVAHFQIKSYSVSVSANPTNGGTVTGGGTFNYGESRTVHASPAEGFAFTNWTDDGDVVSSDADYTFTMTGNRNLVANFTSQPQVPQGAINGQFTINANGDKVYFSRGNLQYNKTTYVWSFMEHQYDVVETLGQNVGENYENQNIVSLFGWGTSGWYDSGATYFRPWDTFLDGGDHYGPFGQYDLTGTFAQADWGVYNPIYQTGNQAGQWRTLTQPEWNYVFIGRSSASLKYGFGCVNGTNGIILLPDSWTLPSGLSFISGNSNWTNNYTAEQWSLMQDNGAVFLPAAGNRYETSANFVGGVGTYWSASCDESDSWDAKCLYFTDNDDNDDGLYTDSRSYMRCLGLSVRLVCPAEN